MKINNYKQIKLKSRTQLRQIHKNKHELRDRWQILSNF